MGEVVPAASQTPAVAAVSGGPPEEQEGLSKLEELRNQFRTKISAEKEQKLKYLNRKENKRKVTINGIVEEFSPNPGRDNPKPHPRVDGETNKPLKSPGLGQRMQTDLVHFGKQPSQKELEVRRRQAILDSLHRKESERKKTDNGYPGSKNSFGRPFKNQLPPIPGSHKKENTETRNTESDLMGSAQNISSENENPFKSKPAMIKRKPPLPEVKSREATEEAGWTSENTGSDKENVAVTRERRRRSPVVSAIQETDRQPLQESRSSNNDSAGASNARGGLTDRTVLEENQAPPPPPSEEHSRPTASSQSRRSVTVKDVIRVADSEAQSNGARTHSRGISATKKPQSSQSQYQTTPNTHPQITLERADSGGHIVSDTITDLENGETIDIEKQRHEALMRVNRNTPIRIARESPRPTVEIKVENGKMNSQKSTPSTADLKSPDIYSDSDIGVPPATGRSRASALRRTESQRVSSKSGAKVSHRKLHPEATETNSGKPKAVSPLSLGTIHEMKRREKDLIDRIRKQQEELEIVRKQRYRQERMYKTATQRKHKQNESGSSRMLSTEEGSDARDTPRAQSEKPASDGEHTTRSYHFPDAGMPPTHKKSNAPKLPPKRAIEIKEDPHYAEIAEKSIPKEIEKAQCEFCGRKFAPERLGKHQKICESVSSKKRSQFESEKHRIKGTGAEHFHNTDDEQMSPAIVHKAHPSQMIKCNWCGKHFPSHSADRHIPVCRKKQQQQQLVSQDSASVASSSNVFIGRS